MRIALWSYIAIYAASFAFLFAADQLVVPAKERAPVLERLLDIAMVSAGLVGMCLYALDVNEPLIKHSWLVVAPALLVGQVAMLARYLLKRKQLLVQADGVVSNSEALLLELAVNALLLPSLILNAAYALR